jgi:Radical SAM superfamily
MFEQSFCSSPWFHARLTYDGTFQECRWFKKQNSTPVNVATTSLLEFYNGERMRTLRRDLLAGENPNGCSTCQYEDGFGKLNGRTRQLLKSGIRKDEFELTLKSSPHYGNFLYSWQNRGLSNHWPTDLQIDLGNLCNSACIMCKPEASSRLQQEYTKLNQINGTLFAKPNDFKSWTQDPEILESFIAELVQIPGIKYIHFLGGETLFDPAFYTICERLILAGRSKDIIVGTTTNGTIYDERVEKLISEFKEFHLGISIESITELNDYVRYPGKIFEILPNIDRYLKLRETTPLYVSLRITPNVFTASELDRLFVYMIERNVIAESCNILFKPDCLRMELMPDEIRHETIGNIENIISMYGLEKHGHLNIRRNDNINEVIADSVLDYHTFLKNYQVPENADELRTKLVSFIKTFETSRGNSILNYLPNYEKFLRRYGY